MTAAPVRRRRQVFPYLLVAPVVAYLAVFLAYPLVRGTQLSFTNTTTLNPRGGTSVGWANYQDFVASDRLASTLGVTFTYAAASVLGALGLGLVAALAMNRPFRGRSVLRATVTIPWAIPQVAIALVFSWIFNNQYGVANYLLTSSGVLDGYTRWLDNPDLALPAVTAVTIWMIFPLAAIVLLAALQSVPGELYEAARVDGADPLSTFRTVTLAAIKPTLLVLALFMTIWALRRFEIIWILTQGGPAEATNTLVVDVYRQAFRHMELGPAAAVGMVGVALSLVVAGGYMLLARREERRA